MSRLIDGSIGETARLLRENHLLRESLTELDGRLRSARLAAHRWKLLAKAYRAWHRSPSVDVPTEVAEVTVYVQGLRVATVMCDVPRVVGESDYGYTDMLSAPALTPREPAFECPRVVAQFHWIVRNRSHLARGISLDGRAFRLVGGVNVAQLAERPKVEIEIVEAPGDRCGNTRALPDGGPCPGCRACC